MRSVDRIAVIQTKILCNGGYTWAFAHSCITPRPYDVSSGNRGRRFLKIGKSKRYVVLDLGDRISADMLLNEKETELFLELVRDNSLHPYSRYSVPRIIPLQKFGRDTEYRHL